MRPKANSVPVVDFLHYSKASKIMRGTKSFPSIKQPESKDCGPTALRIVAKHFKKDIPLSYIRELAGTTRSGSDLLQLSDTAEKLGFRTIGVKCGFDTLVNEVPKPCIVHWNQSHYVVVYKVKKDKVYVSDPANGLMKYKKEDFLREWIGDDYRQRPEDGVVLVIEPTPKLYKEEYDEDQTYNLGYISKYLWSYRKFIVQLFIGLGVASLLQLVFPFLTQSIVDVGIENGDMNFVILILVAQVFLFLGRTSIELVRSWILLHISTRLNISILSDFFIKMMKLPIAFFDTRMIGDMLQRISDHRRIEKLLTSTSLDVLFSAINLVVFGAVLAWYSMTIFFVFIGGSVLYLLWIVFFLRKRKDLDYKTFSQLSAEQSQVVEILHGMQEIKLHNAEKSKRWTWEHQQARLYKLSMKALALEQYQGTGSTFINEIKNILITAISAMLVIQGQLTLGMMMAISYIVGQLNAPIARLIFFVREWQDAKIALERLGEIHNKEDEEEIDGHGQVPVPDKASLSLDKVSFTYKGAHDPVIEELSLQIPHNKVTAIVGPSGSGKTTLMKMLLKFYEPSQGRLRLGNTELSQVSQQAWREQCGVVMQDGYIFNDSIARNIAVAETAIDLDRLNYAMETARIKEFVDSLPRAYHTKIGMEGLGLSGGQKQRLLIARAVYKSPRYLFFDEATSSLDANNERKIMDNLSMFFENKTVVVIAHRLSTVKNADHIIVLDKGKIVENGHHSELVHQRGMYYELVKNQLELGS